MLLSNIYYMMPGILTAAISLFIGIITRPDALEFLSCGLAEL